MTELRGPSAGNGSTGGLIDFVRARLADAERAAPLAAEVMALRASTAGFGARLLREVEAKRRILDLHQPYPHKQVMAWGEIWACSECGDVDDSPTEWPCETVKLLALGDSDHADYRPEWRP